MSSSGDRLQRISDQLAAIADQLGDLAIDNLREALRAEGGHAEAPAELERRITRARRAVEKAVRLLGDRHDDSFDAP